VSHELKILGGVGHLSIGQLLGLVSDNAEKLGWVVREEYKM
jgi:hypothetical protein